jgi:putative endonuclease
VSQFLKRRLSVARRRDEWYNMTHREIRFWYVYILKCADESLYTGITTDLKRRLNEHNNTSKGAKYTSSKRPVELAAYAEVESRSDALKLEYKIKQKKKKEKIKYLLSKGGRLNES